MPRLLMHLLFLAVAIAITIGAYHYLPALIFGGSDSTKPTAAKPDEPVTYVDMNYRDPKAAPAPP